MSKKNLGASMPELDLSSGTLIQPGCNIPKIVGVKPAGSQVLVELLTQQEILNTRFELQSKRAIEEFQGYVKAVGPNMKQDDWGFSVGDRVIVSGGGVPAPNYDKVERQQVLMEPHCIKGVLVEEE